MMEEILEKKVVKKVAPKTNPQLESIEILTKLNGSLVEQVSNLSREIDSLKDKLAQVASRLGL